MGLAVMPLEPRWLLSAANGAAEFSGSWQAAADDDREDDEADEPQQVAGAFLTEVRYGDSRPMSFSDIRQGQLDTCIFSSALSATAYSNFNLESGIREISRTETAITYGVRLFQKSGTTLSAIEQQVVYDGTIRETDLQPRNGKDYWPLIYQRAYVTYATSLATNYRDSVFAFETLIGKSAVRANLTNSITQAEALRSALVAGQATLAGTKAAANFVLENTYGTIKNHGYSILGVTIPTSGSLNNTFVTVRNPWGSDTTWTFYDSDGDGALNSTEIVRSQKGVDGANDGIIKLPWNVFISHFTSWTHTSRTGSNINNIVRVDLPVAFSSETPGPYSVFQGQRLEVPIKATDPEGRFVYYEMVTNKGYIHPQTGVYSWEPRSTDLGTFNVTVKAETNPGDAQYVTFTVNVNNGLPRITKLTASPTTIHDDGSDLLTLNATAETSIGRINDIQYWRDADGNGVLEKTKDVWLGYTGQFYVGGLVPGKQRFFAQARRFSFSDEFYSLPKSVLVTVVAAPKVAPIAIPNGNQVDLSSTGPITTTQKILPAMNEEWSWVLTGTTVRKIDNSGTVLNTFQVAETGATNVTIGTRYDGRLLVVWYKNSTIWCRWYSDSGNTSSNGIVMMVRTGITINGACLQVATNYWGDFALTWHTGAYLEEDVWSMAMKYESTPERLVVARVPWKVSTSATGSQKYPTIAMSRDGKGIIAWTDWAQYGSSKIAAIRFDFYQQQYGSEFVVSSSGGDPDKTIASAINHDNGDAWISWNNDAGIWLQSMKQDGRLSGAAVKANTFSGGRVYGSKLALNSAGWLVAAWGNSTQDGNANDFGGIYAQAFTPGGVRNGPEFAIPSDRTGTQGLTGITLDRQGRLRAVWDHSGSSTTSSIKARFFVVDFPPVVPSGQTFAVVKNTAAGTVLGTIRGFDENYGHTLSWELLNSPGFSISQTGELTASGVLTFSVAPTYTVKVRVTSNGKSVDQTVVVSKTLPVDVKATLLQPADVRQLRTEFGSAVVANADYFVVGAPQTQFHNAEGRVFVYNTTGQLVRTIENLEPGVAEKFGKTLALSGNRLVIEADSVNSYPQRIYVVDLSTGSLLVSFEVSQNYIRTPSISGNLIVIPCPENRQVLVHDVTTGALLRTIDDPTSTFFSTKFGDSAVISGNIIAAGLPGFTDNGTPAAKIYLFDATTGSLIRTLNQPTVSSYESFGSVLAVSGNQLLVGDAYATVQSQDSAGAVHVFDMTTGTLLRSITNPSPRWRERFGESLSVLGNIAAFGADTNGSGISYVFRVSTGNLISTFNNPDDRSVYFPAVGYGRILIGTPNFSLGSSNEDTGAVFVFDTTTKSLTNILFNETPASGDLLGSAVATSETRIVVGAAENDQLGPGSGRAVIYDAKTGTRLFTLDPTLGSGTRFGDSVATWGNIVAVGAPGYNGENGSKIGGSVLIYDATTGSLLRTISNPSSSYDSFGRNVALFGSTLVVGAPSADVGGTDSGIAYVFNVNTGALRATLNNPSPATNDYFGSKLAVSESVIVAGVRYDDTSGTDSGEVYVFSASSGLLIRTLTNPTPDTYDGFGASVAASGDFVGIAAPGDNTQGLRNGQVYLYRLDSGVPVSTISNPSPTSYQNFGYSISLFGNVLVVGNRNFDAPEPGNGIAYTFDVRNGLLTNTLTNPTPYSGDSFGDAVAVAGNTIVVGALYDDTQNTDQGAAYLFELSSRPLELELSTTLIQENAAPNTVVGTFQTYSQALNPVSYFYQLVSGSGDANNASFTISGNQLILNATADYEKRRIYNLRVRTSDTQGNLLEQPITVSVLNQLEGTAAADEFVLTFSATNVAITHATDGGTPVNEGTYSLTPRLRAQGLISVGLTSTDSVRIVGTTANDTFSIKAGSILANLLPVKQGNAAQLFLSGEAGTDLYQIDADISLNAITIADSAGVDTLDFSPSSVAIKVSLKTSGKQTVAAGVTVTWPVNVIENVNGGSGNDILTGSASSNVINGNDGNDLISGGDGSDTMSGGTGDDRYMFAPATLPETEVIVESANGGNDTLDFSALSTSLTLILAQQNFQTVHVNRTLQLSSGAEFENAIGGSGNDALTGNLRNNILVGNAGQDTLNGGAGRDLLIGGAGMDTLRGDDDDDILIAGRTTYDSLISNLNLLVDVWASLFPYAERIASLRAGTGNPVVSLLARRTALNDSSDRDSLTGGNGTDWFFKAADDVITDLVNGEALDLL